jgi:RES domain-containing protein
MQAFRLCRSAYPAYDGEGARRVGGRWNSRGVRVLYMSESRSLAVLDILVHLSSTLPDKYLLGAATFRTMLPSRELLNKICRSHGQR